MDRFCLLTKGDLHKRSEMGRKLFVLCIHRKCKREEVDAFVSGSVVFLGSLVQGEEDTCN